MSELVLAVSLLKARELRRGTMPSTRDSTGFNGRRLAREGAGFYPFPALSRRLLLLWRLMREGHPWPSLARVERTMRCHRFPVIRLLRAVEASASLATHQRDFAASKAGAP